LKAVTVPLPETPDLLAEAGDSGWLFRHEHGGLAAHGESLRIDLPCGLADAGRIAAQALAGIQVEDPLRRAGTGPVALGALPFDPSAPGSLVVPSRIVGVDADGGWVTTIGGGPTTETASEFGAPPDSFTLTSAIPHDEWKDIVTEAIEHMRACDLNKVVLARRVDIEANRPFIISDVLERLASLYPSCMIFRIGEFLGASPELLIRRSGDFVESHPLAGTVARSGDVHGDEVMIARLMSDPKARREHQVVVEEIASVLRAVCEELHVPEQPSVLGLRNVSHLATHITGRLGASAPSALDLVGGLHPTPAVCGSPADMALDYLQKVEGFERGLYAGPVGWVDARGDGMWALGIRSARLSGAHASIFAGNGIVAGSDPEEELTETQLKLQALLAALVRP
jgi:menaquinone-specific isochorismate synthase